MTAREEERDEQHARRATHHRFEHVFPGRIMSSIPALLFGPFRRPRLHRKKQLDRPAMDVKQL